MIHETLNKFSPVLLGGLVYYLLTKENSSPTLCEGDSQRLKLVWFALQHINPFGHLILFMTYQPIQPFNSEI